MSIKLYKYKLTIEYVYPFPVFIRRVDEICICCLVTTDVQSLCESEMSKEKRM
jgi:hypothetical protein